MHWYSSYWNGNFLKRCFQQNQTNTNIECWSRCRWFRGFSQSKNRPQVQKSKLTCFLVSNLYHLNSQAAGDININTQYPQQQQATSIITRQFKNLQIARLLVLIIMIFCTSEPNLISVSKSILTRPLLTPSSKSTERLLDFASIFSCWVRFCYCWNAGFI